MNESFWFKFIWLWINRFSSMSQIDIHMDVPDAPVLATPGPAELAQQSSPLPVATRETLTQPLQPPRPVPPAPSPPLPPFGTPMDVSQLLSQAQATRNMPLPANQATVAPHSATPYLPASLGIPCPEGGQDAFADLADEQSQCSVQGDKAMHAQRSLNQSPHAKPPLTEEKQALARQQLRMEAADSLLRRGVDSAVAEDLLVFYMNAIDNEKDSSKHFKMIDSFLKGCQ